MNSIMKWMVVAVTALVSTSAWAIWNPDTDAALKFNANFQTYDNVAHTTTDAKALLVGTVFDYNTVGPYDGNLFGQNGKVGKDANFAAVHDIGTGAGFDSGVESPNDVKLKVPSNTIFNLGGATIKNTWFFWFNLPNLIQGTVINHTGHTELPQYENKMWEIRVHGGKLHFYHKDNCLRMETAYTLAEMEFSTNTWYSAAVVIDRTNSRETSVPTTQLSTKIYIDGLEVPVIVTSLNNQSMNVDFNYDKPLWIGAGERDFDGLLDDVRLYNRDLNAIEVSILNQPDTSVARALLPIPGSENVVISANLTWDPADGAATQVVFFGTDPENLTQIASGGGALESADPCAGNLYLETEYFWLVNTNGSDGLLWSFVTETGRAINPTPLDGEEDLDNNDINLMWYTPTPATYDVYVSTDWDQVNDLNVNAQRASGLTDPCLMGFDPCNIGGRGQVYFWCVVSTYAGVGTIAGDIWSFRTKPYELIFNTSGVVLRYADNDIPAYSCVLRSNTWSTVLTGTLKGTLADGNAIVDFNFPGPNYFNYDRRYDIIVLPQYRATDVNDVIFPTPLAISTQGDFYFDGRVQIAGDDILTTSQDNTFARSGGYPGPKHNQDESVFPDDTNDKTLFWDIITLPQGNHGRYGAYSSGSDHYIYIPKPLGKSVWGPGQPVNPPYKGGGGGGAGGLGGEAGRGFYFGIDSHGPSYGDEEVPIPFGGSSGGWGGGSSPGGAAGGGGIEIVASGNVVFDSNSQIIANGGSQLCSGVTYPAGGGGGGAVRIIAGGSVTNKGIINVSGGKGGNGSGQGNNTGGGGGGGRVAIFYGTTCSEGSYDVNGGKRGTISDGTGLAEDGQAGTFFKSNGSPKKASAPTPKDGNPMAYCNPDPCNNFQLKWYSGYGGTTDVVYLDTFSPPTTQRALVPATRGQHSVTLTVSSGNTYYWKVVTDGVSGDIWSFKTVTWQCPFAIAGRAPHVGGPEWDFNHDCVIDLEDVAFFVQYWVSLYAGSSTSPYFIDNPNFANFASEWKMCDNRTGGCNDWPD